MATGRKEADFTEGLALRLISSGMTCPDSQCAREIRVLRKLLEEEMGEIAEMGEKSDETPIAIL